MPQASAREAAHERITRYLSRAPFIPAFRLMMNGARSFALRSASHARAMSAVVCPDSGATAEYGHG